MIVNFCDLQELRKQNINKKIVLAIGTFDLFHFEHLNYLKDAKKLGDILVVAIKSNFLVKFKSQERPIIDEKQRLEIVDNLKCVDYTILCDEKIFLKTKEENNFLFDEKNNNWLCSFFELCKMLRPNIIYHEDTNCFNDARKFVSEKFDIKLVERKRTAFVTTTKIIEKIKSTN